MFWCETFHHIFLTREMVWNGCVNVKEERKHEILFSSVSRVSSGDEGRPMCAASADGLTHVFVAL